MSETHKRRLGVVGTLVWDTILMSDRGREPIEEWGGISYALGSFAASLPSEWEILPIIKVGEDLAEDAYRFLRGIPRVRVEPGVQIVPVDNNRVRLEYDAEGHRGEWLRGGVPPWSWTELAPLVRECDALYVNFISGFELTLDTARSLRDGFAGPTYADLHSLFLGVAAGGHRVPQELPSWGSWLRCFDAIQVNELEFELLGRAWGDPWQLAADTVGPELKLILVTMGPKGAAYVAGAGPSEDPWQWSVVRRQVGVSGTSRSGWISPDTVVTGGDPTGCGDVWGATFFSGLLAGSPLYESAMRANQIAARNLECRGARDLHLHLSGKLLPGA